MDEGVALDSRSVDSPSVSVSASGLSTGEWIWIDVEQRYKQLVDSINYHNYRYYVLDSPEIADAEYDQLMQELRAIEAEFEQVIQQRSAWEA